MSWNNGYKKRIFDKHEEKLASEYRKAGMSEDAIKEMYLFDCKTYRRDRIYVYRTQPVFLDEDFDSESRNSLYDSFMNSLSIEMVPFENHPFGWIEQIENQTLYKALATLTDEQRELLTYVHFYGYSESYIATYILKISIPGVHYRLSQIYKKIVLYFMKKEGFKNV